MPNFQDATRKPLQKKLESDDFDLQESDYFLTGMNGLFEEKFGTIKFFHFVFLLNSLGLYVVFVQLASSYVVDLSYLPKCGSYGNEQKIEGMLTIN